MTARTASCPNCGATIRFRYAQAVQTVCEYCRAVLVRQDVSLEQIGTVAALPATSTPIQLGTTGRWRDRAFEVVGRLQYRWERGRWSEWHCVLGDGASAWLSDAQLEYAMSRLVTPEEPLPPATALTVGQRFRWEDTAFEVATLTQAQYEGTEGDLPFTYWDKRTCWFADLRNATGRFATIDYSDAPPLLYVGEALTFAELHLDQVREFDEWPVSARGTR
ncbi:MAG: DUF4178 domain-containing protein [Gemmatimonadaceae bacterium]|jgi:hypothetical protein|nr:DUF4178 domain-containing protein [Gemmatimonadaceae bacterium]